MPTTQWQEADHDKWLGWIRTSCTRDMRDSLLLDGIEVAGTKFLYAVADRDGCSCWKPGSLPRLRLNPWAPSGFPVLPRTDGALSIGRFRPLSLNPLASHYGCITSTLKAFW